MLPKKHETMGSCDLLQARLGQIIFLVSRSFPFAPNRRRMFEEAERRRPP
jgi:hypothetical protein